MRYKTNEKGDIGKFKIMEDLIKKGFYVSLPFQENLPYDLIAHDPKTNKIYRIQCKYSAESNKMISNSVGGYKENDFDYYGIFLAKECYILYPSIKFKQKTIRTTIPNSSNGYYWYEDFLNFTDNAQKKPGKVFKPKKCCDKISLRKTVRPTKEQLEKEISELGYCGTGRKYGVSNNTIKNWQEHYKKMEPSQEIES